MQAALDAGVDGITLAAGLHLGSFSLIEDHPRFRDAMLGVIVSSLRALQLFIRKTVRCNRLPDYVVVEGPLAGGHLGFGMDWKNYDLATIVAEIKAWLHAEKLNIPLIPAGGIFTGSDAVAYLENGASAVQVATRFTVARECGLPEDVQQEYFKASEDEIEVNQISPTGYPMRMLSKSPAIGDGIRPNCEAYGYLLDANASMIPLAPVAGYTRAGFLKDLSASLQGEARLMAGLPQAPWAIPDLERATFHGIGQFLGLRRGQPGQIIDTPQVDNSLTHGHPNAPVICITQRGNK